MTAVAQDHRRFTVDELERMLAAGILGEDEPLELIEGSLVVVSPQGPFHAHVITVLAGLLRGAWAAGIVVREEKPLRVDAHNLPEPDIAVVRGAAADFAGRHPEAAEAVLVVEVAHSSQAADRRKAGVYARAGVAELWLLDLAARQLEVHTEPQPDGRYRAVRVLAAGDEVSPPGSSERFAVADLLP